MHISYKFILSVFVNIFYKRKRYGDLVGLGVEVGRKVYK
jgi:hypothetical protein